MYASLHTQILWVCIFISLYAVILFVFSTNLKDSMYSRNSSERQTNSVVSEIFSGAFKLPECFLNWLAGFIEADGSFPDSSRG